MEDRQRKKNGFMSDNKLLIVETIKAWSRLKMILSEKIS